jgi:hypothetical protein
VLFNYQSYAGNPAVLTILVTREGTSVTIIDNTRDAFDSGSVWGQRLFHNKNGQRASLTGERESEFLAKPENAQVVENSPSVGQEKGLNMVLMIQVPLKFSSPVRSESNWMDDMSVESAPVMAFEGAGESNVENAVIGSGPVEGPFTEIDGIDIERDPNFPVRVTVQFYKATSNGIMNEADMKDIAGQIRRVFEQGEYVSSLVTGGKTGRPTEYFGNKVQPADWWDKFWENYEKQNGISREEARRKLRELIGPRYFQEPVTELYLRDVLRSDQKSQ